MKLEWHRIEDKEPELNATVLVFDEDLDACQLCEVVMKRGQIQFRDAVSDFIVDDISHWAHVPRPNN